MSAIWRGATSGRPVTSNTWRILVERVDDPDLVLVGREGDPVRLRDRQLGIVLGPQRKPAYRDAVKRLSGSQVTDLEAREEVDGDEDEAPARVTVKGRIESPNGPIQRMIRSDSRVDDRESIVLEAREVRMTPVERDDGVVRADVHRDAPELVARRGVEHEPVVAVVRSSPQGMYSLRPSGVRARLSIDGSYARRHSTTCPARGRTRGGSPAVRGSRHPRSSRRDDATVRGRRRRECRS